MDSRYLSCDTVYCLLNEVRTDVINEKRMSTNAILNLIKQTCQIIFPLITFPYISRILGPEGYGEYSFSSTIVNYFLLLSSFGISSYSIREGAKIRNNGILFNTFANQVFTINVLTMLVSYSAMVVLLTINPKIQQYMVLIIIQSIAMFLNTVGADWINVVYEDYLYITVRYIVIQIVALFSIFMFVKSREDVYKYCLISVLASNGGNIINCFYIRRYTSLQLTMKPNFHKHFVSMLILFVNSIAITIYVNADITMLGMYYSDEVVGVYSFSSKIYNLLKMMINAIVVVTVPKMAALVECDTNKYKNYIQSISSGITIILLPVAIGLCCMSTSIITLAGGKQYQVGTSALRILSVAMIPAIYASITTNCVLIASGKEKYCLKATIISALINISMNFIFIPYIGLCGAAITTVIAEIVNFGIQYYFAKKSAGSFFENRRLIATCALGCVYIVIACLICNTFFVNEYEKLLAAVISSMVGYSIIMWIRERKVIFNIVKLFRESNM
ncbi:MAG: sugar transporter [Clostridium sp.]|nr:MAG: sugar transporter [Clostridium sp.]